MAISTVILALNEEQRHAVVGALYDKLGETEHYLLSYRHDADQPAALDTCCDGHLARYNERISQRDSLRDRKELLKTTIELVDSAEPSDHPVQQQYLCRAGVEFFPDAHPEDPSLPTRTIFIDRQHLPQQE